MRLNGIFLLSPTGTVEQEGPISQREIAEAAQSAVLLGALAREVRTYAGEAMADDMALLAVRRP